MRTRIAKSVAWLIAGLILGLGAPSFGTPVAKRMKPVIDFLNEEGQFRMPFTYAPGNGHQAANVLLIKQLRGWGYTGQIELRYEESQKTKLELLLPKQDRQKLNVTVLPLDESKPAPMMLAITAADDENVSPAELNVRAVIQIEPPNWSTPPQIYLDFDDHAHFENYAHYPSLYLAPKIDDVAAYVQNQFAELESLKTKTRGVTTLIQAGRDRRIIPMSIYGVGIKGAFRIAKLIRAVEFARQQEPARFPAPIVLSFLSNLKEEEWFVVRRILGEMPPVLDIRDANLAARFSSAKPGEILLLNTGSVTQDVFNTLMDDSQLPPTAAGKSAINFLSNRGKAFFPLTPDHELNEMLYGPLGISDLPGIFSGKRVYPTETTRLGILILESMRPESEVAKQFAKLAKSRARLGDRSCATLLAAMPVLYQLRNNESDAEIAATLRALQAHHRGLKF